MRRVLWTTGCGFVLGVTAAVAGSLPTVAVGPLPGPPVLYEPAATTPVLENVGIWRAKPLMVSGAEAYAQGEYLYQDFVYDSYGANTTDLPFASPDTVPPSADLAFGGMTGDVVYPTDVATYGHDAADLLELRARLVGEGVGYRITLNTMLAPDVAGVAIGLDTDGDAATGTGDWGYGIGSLGDLGLEHVIVTWGSGAALDGDPIPSTADVERNQIEVRVPLVPAGATWRHYLVVGLFDATAGTFRQILESPTATAPGGAHGTMPPPVFNVGFRFAEPMGNAAGEAGSRSVGYGHWREHGQAKALAARDISAFHADVDFAKLAARANESHVPETGTLARLYVSHLDLGEGAGPERPMLHGKIQPYSVYVPTSYTLGGRPALHVVLHSLSCSYNQYAVLIPNMIRQLGEERNAFVLTAEGRGPDGWYHHEGEVDLFEAWADLARRYRVDARRTTLSGYSMGGYGTFKMGSQYPDLFARAFAIVGPADENIAGGPTGGRIREAETQDTLQIADNLYDLPLLMWNGLVDELVPVAGVVQYESRLYDLGYRHELDLFTSDHFLFGVVDQWDTVKPFLSESLVNRDPARVVYRVLPELDDPAHALVHDHAYWVSDVVAVEGARSGLVDARSLARGVGLPVPFDYPSAGAEPLPHVGRGTAWLTTAEPAGNELVVGLSDVASATLWVERAGIDPARPIVVSVDSNGPATLTLAGTFGSRTIDVSAPHTTVTVEP